MKKGDSLRVFIENVQVGRGEITAVREGEIEVTVPGFVSVIATRTSLTDAPTSLEQNNSNREVQVTGLEVVNGDGESVTSIDADRIVDGAITAHSKAPEGAQSVENINTGQSPSENKTEVTEAPTPSGATAPDASAPNGSQTPVQGE